MEFDRHTIALLVHNPDGPELDERAAAELQDAHLSHLADLYEAGHLVAAGPVADAEIRGFSILRVDPERARELKEADPAVRAGIYTIRTAGWHVPAGAVQFAPARFPRSVAEVRGG